MVKYLFIPIILLTFTKGIDGSRDPLIREKLIPPFPFNNKDKVIERVSKMSKRKTITEVIDGFQRVWGNTYDYSLIKEYNNNKEKLPIVCHEHGIFYQSYADHSKHHGCPMCANQATSERCRITVDEFKKRANKIHNNKYDYSLITKDNYTPHKKLPIICPTHGLFYQFARDHLSGRGCYLCGKESMAAKQRYTKEELVALFNKVHNNKYDYSLFDGSIYKCRKDKIKVICPHHGDFEVSVDNHLYRQSGCPMCKRSLGEERISAFLDKNDMKYKEQHCFPNEDLFCKNLRLQVDFFLPEMNTVIEYNGIQHYKEIGFFNLRSLQEQQARDMALRQYCKNHKIRLIEIPYKEYDNIDKILKKELNS